jgi:hypothetical protein
MPITIDGTGSISGLSAGGLPDLTVVTADIAAGAVTQAKRSEDLTQGTAIASTSGTAIDFTGIPSWAKRITVMLSGVSTNGTSQPMIQIGTSGGVQATGYSANTCSITSGANATTNYTNGWQLYTSLAANVFSGVLTLVQQDPGNGTWVGTGLFSISIPSLVITSGTKTLSGTLDRVRITTANGTDAFDAGSINILYE